MDIMIWVSLAVSVFLFVYLLVALLRPNGSNRLSAGLSPSRSSCRPAYPQGVNQGGAALRPSACNE